MFIELSATFHVTFVLILYFDWLQGPHIGLNFEKHSKIFFSETVKWIKPVLCIHVPDSGLYTICVFIQGEEELWLLWQLKSFHRRIMGKVEIGYFSAKIADI